MTEPGATRRVRVEPASAAAYDVEIGSGILPRAMGRLAEVLGLAKAPGRAVVVLDANVPDAFVGPALEAIERAGTAVVTHTIDPSERVKSLETFGAVLGTVAGSRLERREPIVAIGGGIVGDIAGFCASAYRRGVPVVQCPTTLLAAVDASVGGKTGVNLLVEGGALLKNMAGAFHQPRLVVADVDAFTSLGEREFRAGLAECLKHGMIAGGWGDQGLAAWLDGAMPRLRDREPGALIECVHRNVAVKAAVVAADEREQSDTGGRALLNLGHTYAHAMETLDGLTLGGYADGGDRSGDRSGGGPRVGPVLHGEAVGLGLIAAAACAASLDMIDEAEAARARETVASAGLPTTVAGLPDDGVLLGRMLHDKKAAGGRLRLTLPLPGARATLTNDPSEDAVRAGWRAIRG